MKQLLLPLFASVLVGFGAPAQAQNTFPEYPPNGRVSNAQLYILGGLGGGLPGIWLSPAVWHATDGDVFTWSVAGGALSAPLWGATYMLLGAAFSPFFSKEEKQ